MSATRWTDLTWTELRDLNRERAVPLLPVGATEAHGPHLAVSTDVVISEAMVRAGAAKLRQRGREPVLLPPLHYTAAPFARAFPGTISVEPGVVLETVVGIARSLTEQGFRVLAIANSHLDPAHLAALNEAVAVCDRERLLPVAFPDLTRKPWALRLTDEFKSGACHAGQYETSVVLAEAPDLVRDAVRAELPDNPRSIGDAIREGKSTFEDAGGPEAYFGFPARATAEEGRKTVEVLGEILAEAVLDACPEIA
ncbi:MAG: creatininase family protein [Gemmatimonadetes bacterium]|nr:creatininase family protein [Gemmatimonadota bacterium]